MLRKSILPLLLLGTSGCLDWNDIPNTGSNNLSSALWDANVVAVDDGIYVSLPASKRGLCKARWRVVPRGSARWTTDPHCRSSRRQ